MALKQTLPGGTGTKRHGITIVGCGPGDLDYLTPAALRSIENAEVLVGASRLLGLFPSSTAERICVGGDTARALAQIADHVNQRNVVVLVSGDPGVCSLAQPVIRRFGASACRIIPGISSLQVAFARLGVDWTDARLVSAHHCQPNLDFAALASESKIAVLAGNVSTTPWIVALANHLAETHRLFACEDLTLPQEHVYQLSADRLAAAKLSPQSILLLIGKKILG